MGETNFKLSKFSYSRCADGRSNSSRTSTASTGPRTGKLFSSATMAIVGRFGVSSDETSGGNSLASQCDGCDTSVAPLVTPPGGDL